MPQENSGQNSSCQRHCACERRAMEPWEQISDNVFNFKRYWTLNFNTTECWFWWYYIKKIQGSDIQVAHIQKVKTLAEEKFQAKKFWLQHPGYQGQVRQLNLNAIEQSHFSEKGPTANLFQAPHPGVAGFQIFFGEDFWIWIFFIFYIEIKSYLRSYLRSLGINKRSIIYLAWLPLNRLTNRQIHISIILTWSLLTHQAMPIHRCYDCMRTCWSLCECRHIIHVCLNCICGNSVC